MIVYDVKNLHLKLEPFFIEFGSNYLHGDILPVNMDTPPEVLCLHGLGAEGRKGFLLLRQVLWEKYAISSCAFDFCECCGSGADYVGQATDIIDACFDSKAFSIIAADVSVPTALSLADTFSIRRMVFLNPPENLHNAGHFLMHSSIAMPVDGAGTLTYMNNTPALLMQVAALLKSDAVHDARYYLMNSHKECSA